MCLAEIYTDADMNRIVEELPEVAPGVVGVWKAAIVRPTAFEPIICRYQVFQNGTNFAKKTKIKNETNQAYYWTGYHFGQSKQGALNWYGKGFSIPTAIRCYVLKEWITSIGKQCGQWNSGIYTTIVASQAFFPTYPETEARLEDFLNWLKENDLEWAESQLERIEL